MHTQTCQYKKCGEYNMLKCCLDKGHKGECCFVVDKENDYPANKNKEQHEKNTLKS